MKRKVILFASFILMTGILSVFRCSCHHDYGLNSIDASLKRIIGTELYVDTMPDSRYFILEDIYSQGDTVSIAFDSLVIMVETNYNMLSHNFYRNFPGIQSAYATSVSENYEKVMDITIFSNKNYNAEYPAGSNLKGLISAHTGHYVTDCMTIDDMIEEVSWRDGWRWSGPPLLYTLNIPPETEEVHEITVRYRTEKNQIFSAVVKNVTILK